MSYVGTYTQDNEEKHTSISTITNSTTAVTPETETESKKRVPLTSPPTSLAPVWKLLLPHERHLVLHQQLDDITHRGSSAIWLTASSTECGDGMTCVYRPMGDDELLYLVNNGILPDTQPYQAIIEGAAGRTYAEKYLNGTKWVDTHPTSVVEFSTPRALIDQLFTIQHKAEDGALSMGLGSKAGKGLPLFNASLIKGDTTWRIVKVKRVIRKKEGKR